ncbi:hypothetical protein TD95_004434 [Thielaviopsis punctulata]|uniref:RTA1 like protein n=1 Tax=Thielaviopsis punctulata TaxID=72032 RepID=A0A0F4ZFD7_9PEZI|nr:hypothetical protein TD95_004434 [Thielaviopsis punctulata]
MSSDYTFRLYRYTPSLPAAVAAMAIFGILTGWHFFMIFRHKSRYFTPFAIGGVFETVGYFGRVLAHYDTNSIPKYVVQQLLILLAPALFAASIYMILGRLIRTIRADHLSLVPLKYLTKIFVAGDCISFLLQMAGGGIQSSGSLKMYDLGEKIILVGLFIQIAFFGFFIIVSIVFNKRLVSNPTPSSLSGMTPWKTYMMVLYSTSILILVRSIFRVIEFTQGNAGYIISHELFLYIFDAVLMAITMAIFMFKYVDGLESIDETASREIPGSHDMMLDTISESQMKHGSV